MKKLHLTLGLLFPCFLLAAQSPFPPQLTVPVHFHDVFKKVANAGNSQADLQLSGMALMFLDTTKMNDELVVTGRAEPVIWYDHIGQSLKVTFVVPKNDMIGHLELTYFDSKCAATIWRQDRLTNEVVHAKGDLLEKNGSYSLHFTADERSRQGIGEVIESVNLFLMKLHTKVRTPVAVKSWYNRDSLNVIVGADSQFDTDYELFWFDKSVRNRLQMLASNAFSKLILFQNNSNRINDKVDDGQEVIIHEAMPVGLTGQRIAGNISVIVQPGGAIKYLFLKPGNSYRIFLEYSFSRRSNGPGEFSINRLGLKNIQTGDFIEMEVYDLVNSGIPILYVDLIRGVVMEDGGPWDVTNVIHAIEDVLGMSKLPFE